MWIQNLTWPNKKLVLRNRSHIEGQTSSSYKTNIGHSVLLRGVVDVVIDLVVGGCDKVGEPIHRRIQVAKVLWRKGHAIRTNRVVHAIPEQHIRSNMRRQPALIESQAFQVRRVVYFACDYFLRESSIPPVFGGSKNLE